ncbi:unnamed protein product [Trichogramma brassicae]|uniref:Uncharacterized protein n=1 Tax=Trichogramma brassicae TaxID=86971 RepID=A0A6H5IQ55_9HYME|nr:unnamed protein product [Trichogramma brassicae]
MTTTIRLRISSSYVIAPSSHGRTARKSVLLPYHFCVSAFVGFAVVFVGGVQSAASSGRAWLWPVQPRPCRHRTSVEKSVSSDCDLCVVTDVCDVGRLNQQKLKSLREKVNWEIEKERHDLLDQLYPIIKDWVGQRPNLRDIFRPEEIERLLSDSVECILKDHHYHQSRQFVDFVIGAGYKDDRKIDRVGKLTRAVPTRRTTPLHRATRGNYGDIVRDLFKVYDRVENCTDEDGLSHFHVACEYGCYEEVERFLWHGQRPDLVVRKSGDSPLMLAMRHGRNRVAESLLRRGADPDLANKRGQTALHAMCNPGRRNNFDTASLFFKIVDVLWLSVRLDARDDRGNTPLHLALSNSSKETVLLLLLRGADLSLINDDGVTPLHRICQRVGDDNDMDTTLIHDWLKPLRGIHERFDDRDLHETFFNVCEEKNIEVRIDARDKLGNTPLHEAARRGNSRMVKLLLESGANSNLAVADGSNPLYLMCFGVSSYDMMELLMLSEKNGCQVQVDTRDKSGNTLLHLVLKRGDYMDAAVFLLRRGADPNTTNEEGQTPVHVICQNRHIGLSTKKFFKAIDEIEAPPLQVNARDKKGRAPLQCRGEFFALGGRRASAALAIVEHLENKGYELDRSEALIVMKLFAEYEMFERPTELGERWYDDESFANDAKDSIILPIINRGCYREANATTMTPRLSLYDLIQLPAEEVNELFTYTGFYEFTDWNSSVMDMDTGSPHADVCARHLCEKLSRRFFWPWALIAFSELIHYRLPNLCCDMVIEHLTNEDLFNICLAAEGPNKRTKKRKKQQESAKVISDAYIRPRVYTHKLRDIAVELRSRPSSLQIRAHIHGHDDDDGRNARSSSKQQQQQQQQRQTAHTRILEFSTGEHQRPNNALHRYQRQERRKESQDITVNNNNNNDDIAGPRSRSCVGTTTTATHIHTARHYINVAQFLLLPRLLQRLSSATSRAREDAVCGSVYFIRGCCCTASELLRMDYTILYNEEAGEFRHEALYKCARSAESVLPSVCVRIFNRHGIASSSSSSSGGNRDYYIAAVRADRFSLSSLIQAKKGSLISHRKWTPPPPLPSCISRSALALALASMAERATAYALLIYSAPAFFAARENYFSLSFEFDNRYLNSVKSYGILDENAIQRCI